MTCHSFSCTDLAGQGFGPVEVRGGRRVSRREPLSQLGFLDQLCEEICHVGFHDFAVNLAVLIPPETQFMKCRVVGIPLRFMTVALEYVLVDHMIMTSSLNFEAGLNESIGAWQVQNLG